MDFADLVARRRMTRGYSSEPVPREVLERIAARVQRGTPSAGYSQGVRLVVVQDEARRRRIAELADQPYYLAHGYLPWMTQAPVHVVVLVREQDYHDRYTEPGKLEDDGSEMDWPAPYWWIDAGQALMLVQLAAIDEGLGCGVFTLYPKPNNDVLIAELGLPADWAMVGVVALGHAAPEPKEEHRAADLRRRRRDSSELVRWL